MHKCGVWKGDTDERICRAGVELQTQRGREHGKRGRGVNGSLGLTHAHYRVTQLVGGVTQHRSSAQSSVMACRGGAWRPWGGAHEGGDPCIQVAGSLCCAAEADTAL